MLKEEVLEGNLTLEDLENYLIPPFYIKIVCLFEDGFGWDLWENGNISIGI